MNQKYISSFNIIKVKKIDEKERRIKWFLILIGLFFAIIFFQWILNPELRGYRPLYWLLISSFIFSSFRILIEWYFTLNLKINTLPKSERKWEVDVLTTYCDGEPKEMVLNTLRAILKINYPHVTYLCDEEDDPQLKKFCDDNGIIHVTRKDKVDAKAGNINNTLKKYAKGEICLILDPDHVPHQDFFKEILPHFEDEEVGYVQTVQGYYNQHLTVIAKASAEQSYLFYGPIMMGLNKLGSVPVIGANCVFRRKALDSIGGHAAGTTEDMHTSMLLHSKGWKSIYVPQLLSRGLVPWNYSGYCKQQLKWTRGTFSLIVSVIPKIFSRLKISQKIYYISCGFFFLYGLKGLIDILLPVLSLLLVKVPVKIGLLDFFKYYLPFLLITQIIRQFNQRWVLNDDEKGFYFLGGILLKSTWWVSLLGLFYTIFNKKVPYVPTPKENEAEIPWKLFIPNILVISITFLAIIYGLYRDFNPFSLFMASIGFANIFILSFGTLMSAQKLIIKIHSIFKNTLISKGSRIRLSLYNLRVNMYNGLQRNSLYLLSSTIIIYLILNIYGNYSSYQPELPEKKFNKFLGFETTLKTVSESSNVRIHNINTITQVDTLLLINLIEESYESNQIPFFFFQMQYQQDTLEDKFRQQLKWLGQFQAKVLYPLFISIKRQKNGSINDEFFYYNTFLKVASILSEYGAGNSAFIWEYSNGDNQYIEKSKEFISGISISEDNLTNNYNSIIRERLPIFLWNYNPQLGYTFDLSKIMQLNLMYDKPISERSFKIKELNDFKSTNVSLTFSDDYLEDSVKRMPINLVFNDEGFRIKTKNGLIYLKGIAYNPGHDWQDNSYKIPLTAEKLDADFIKIKEMGANVIRRYSSNIFDYNILNACKRHDLKLLYGFWFDPKVDYLIDIKEKEKYRRKVINAVIKYRNNDEIIGWSIGNETWGMLKHHFGEPYLSSVRKMYIRFLEELAQDIRKIDPDRPIFSMVEFSPQLPTVLNSFNHFAPSINSIGINCYYEQQLQVIDSLFNKFYTHKPYLISEFGPKGYWVEQYNDYVNDSILFEPSSYTKAAIYAHNWNDYVVKYDQKNLGGIAFCWQDRFEGTSTWFGITDINGYLKPAYYSLKSVWKNQEVRYSLPDFEIIRVQNDKNDLLKYKAVTRQNLENPAMRYKWYLYEDNNYKKILETDFSESNEVIIKRLEKGKSFKLSLHVTKDFENVITRTITL